MRWTSGIGKMTVDKPAEQACRFPQNLHPRLRIYRRLFSTVGNTGLIGKAIPTIPGNTRYFMRYLQHTACKKSAHCPAILWREPKQLQKNKIKILKLDRMFVRDNRPASFLSAHSCRSAASQRSEHTGAGPPIETQSEAGLSLHNP